MIASMLVPQVSGAQNLSFEGRTWYKQIRERGLKLLEFMSKRWNINIGDDAQKLRLLGLVKK